jgi:hypothetical protein
MHYKYLYCLEIQLDDPYEIFLRFYMLLNNLCLQKYCHVY